MNKKSLPNNQSPSEDLKTKEALLAACRAENRHLGRQNDLLKSEIDRLKKEVYELKTDIRAISDMLDGY